jgi:hypothetical protein
MRTSVRVLLYGVLAVCLWGTFGALFMVPGVAFRERLITIAWFMGVALVSALLNGFLSQGSLDNPKGLRAFLGTTPMMVVEVSYVAVLALIFFMSLASRGTTGN